MGPTQKKWNELRQKLGEPAARAHVVAMLRHAADLVEQGNTQDPDVFGCDVPDVPFEPGVIMETFRVDISYPWPG
jgi:hypothetical protein